MNYKKLGIVAFLLLMPLFMGGVLGGVVDGISYVLGAAKWAIAMSVFCGAAFWMTVLFGVRGGGEESVGTEETFDTDFQAYSEEGVSPMSINPSPMQSQGSRYNRFR